MTVNSENQEGTPPNLCFVPGLETAIATWNTAKYAFQRKRCNQNQDEYMRASDELGQAIGSWAKSEPELAYQFGLWFRSHEADWDGK